MKEISVPMALVDLIPVVLFFLASRMIVNDLDACRTKLSSILFQIGAYLVTAAGLLKAIYKLLYALGAGDFIWMNNQMFPNQAIGFLLAGIGLMLSVKEYGKRAYAILPTMALVGMMVIGLGAMDAALCSLAAKRGKTKALVLFVVSFFLSLCMGYLSSRSFDTAAMNWIAQGVNILGQGCLLGGCLVLKKNA